MVPTTLSPEQLSWLREAVSRKLPYRHMARRIGVCTDTLKRILVREGIADFPGAKYTISPARQTATWTRPCIKCRVVSTRPRLQFLCDTCSSTVDDEADDDCYVAHLPC